MKKFNTVLRLFTCLFVVLLTVFMTVGSTFSWYDRTKSSDKTVSKVLSYTKSGTVTSQSPKTITTFVGADSNGVISYDTPLSDTGEITLYPGKPTYLKTVIADTGNSGDSAVSLYVSGFSCTTNMGGGYHIGLVSPEKTYNSLNGSTDGEKIVFGQFCIEDQITVPSNSSVEIYWFILPDATDFSGAGTGTFTVGNMYTVFN